MNNVSSKLASPLWLLLAASCGSPPEGGAQPDAGPPLPELGACADKWHLIMDAQPFFTPRALRWRDGVVYFSGGTTAGIQSVAATGGSPAVIVSDQVWSLWIEGDRLLYTNPSIGKLRLHSVPVTGGTPTLVLETSTRVEGGDPHSVTQALDASHLYWDTDAGGARPIWRMPRAGGPPEQLATIPSRLVETLTPTNRGLLVSTKFDDSFLVPTDGGEVRRLVKGGEFMGASSEDVLWWRPRAAPPGFEVLRSRLDGTGPEPFWPSKPPAMLASQAWSTGDGGWIISGLERFADDGELHMSLWHVDRDQAGVRLACSRPAGSATASPTEAAVAPDAIYLAVVSHEQSATLTWSILRLPR